MGIVLGSGSESGSYGTWVRFGISTGVSVRDEDGHTKGFNYQAQLLQNTTTMPTTLPVPL